VEGFQQELKYASKLAAKWILLVAHYDSVPPILGHDPGVRRTAGVSFVAFNIAPLRGTGLPHLKNEVDMY